MKRQISLLLFLLIACSTTARSEERIQFNRDIRPILAENCFHCHGPDGSHREGELRLDVRDDAVRMLAIIPGDATKSHLMERVLTSDESELMPPPKSNKTLTTKEKETLKRWIEEGALYEGHWAFIPPVVPELPKREPGSTAHPIDVLVQEKLAVGLATLRRADGVAVVRLCSLCRQQWISNRFVATNVAMARLGDPGV